MERNGETHPILMIHHECLRCPVTATMVVTDASDRAWEDHMATHTDRWAYESWTWEVAKIPGF